MTLAEAVKSLRYNDDYKVILENLSREREVLINDFHQPEILENPQALARLAGEIASVDRIIKSLTYESE